MKADVSFWKCMTCGAKNASGGNRCRICLAFALPSVSPVAAAAPPAWVPPAAPPQPQAAWNPLPPPPPPVAPRSRGGGAAKTIALVVVGLLVALGITGAVFGRQDDPEAARDRKALEASVLTVDDLGGGFAVEETEAFTRSNGGLEIKSGGPCVEGDSIIEAHGQARVSSVFTRQGPATVQVVATEIYAVADEAQAERLFVTLKQTGATCLADAMMIGGERELAEGDTVSAALQPTLAADIGDEAFGFEGSVVFSGSGGTLNMPVTVVLAVRGRALVVVLTLDTNGGLSQRAESLAGTIISRIEASSLLPQAKIGD